MLEGCVIARYRYSFSLNKEKLKFFNSFGVYVIFSEYSLGKKLGEISPFATSFSYTGVPGSG